MTRNMKMLNFGMELEENRNVWQNAKNEKLWMKIATVLQVYVILPQQLLIEHITRLTTWPVDTEIKIKIPA